MVRNARKNDKLKFNFLENMGILNCHLQENPCKKILKENESMEKSIHSV